MNDRSTGKFDRDEHVLVIGLGRSGRASAEVLRERVGSLIVTDEKPQIELREAISDLAALGVRFVVPDELGPALASITAAVLSPGIPLNGELVRRIQSAGIPVFSEVEVAYRICKAPIVAVTGTKGKTTTTTLIGEIFKRAGKTTFVGGNIGNALIHETAVATASDWIIAEVSSFQLETIRSFKPKISAITNISPDHLDRYHSMDEYAEAKFRIFANQGAGDTFVGNFDDERIAALLTGGEDEASRIHTQARWFAREPHRETALYLRDERTIVYAPPTGDPRPVEIMDVAEIPLLGDHNIENVMTAILVALAAGLEREAIVSACATFTRSRIGSKPSPTPRACCTSMIRKPRTPAASLRRCVRSNGRSCSSPAAKPRAPTLPNSAALRARARKRRFSSARPPPRSQSPSNARRYRLRTPWARPSIKR